MFRKVRICVMLVLWLVSTATAQHAYIDWVNPFVGTTNFGTCNPGAVVPNGMMQVVPFNVMGSAENNFDKDSRWWSTPYEFTNKFFTGFAHGALSGVGCPEMGAILTTAMCGSLDVDYRNYGSTYHNEEAIPGYYALTLDKYNIRAEVSATERTSIEKYTFDGGEGHIIINLGEGLTNESGAMVHRVSSTEIEGMKLLGTFCYNPQKVFPIYFVAQVSKKPTTTGYYKKQRPMTGVEAEWTPDNGKYKYYTEYGGPLCGDDVGYYFSYDNLAKGESIIVRVGISYTSIDNARLNLTTEQNREFEFDKICSVAKNEWNKVLGRIRVNGGTEEQKKVFYTALYHALLHPNLVSDVSGDYPIEEHSGTIGNAKYNRYTVFSLWDTYRNLHQLLTLVYPEKQIDMLRTMVDMSAEWGWLPKWELYGKETFTMEGDPAIPVIVDSYRKGLTDFDIDKAYAAMVRSATTQGNYNPMRPDIDPYIEKGYIPLGYFAGDNSGDNSVSHALEYYVADAALAYLAGQRGDEELANKLIKRSKGYKKYYCKDYGTLRPINIDGTFLTPFNPTAGENFEAVPGFHEGTAWNYTFFIPHDVDGLIDIMGGKRKFVDKLQMIFDKGYYDPSNEPDIAYPYLFSRVKGEEWRTQDQISKLLAKYFTTKPNGIPGNDDCGTMSAWAVFSMLGLYPDCPGEPYYTLTTPTFDSAEIDTSNGTIVISKKGNGKHIKRMKLANKSLTEYRISHNQLLNGKNLTFETK